MSKNKLQVGPQDAGLVFRADGRIEVMLPRFAENGEVPENVLTADALLWASQNPEMMEQILDAMDEEDAALDLLEAADGELQH